MIWHDLRLALKSVRRNPLLSSLIVAVIAIGIGTSVIATTLYRAKAGNPIWWKNDVLYRVMIDSRPANHQSDTPQHPEFPPFTLIYRDALAIYQSKIPERSLIEFHSDGLADSSRPGDRPFHSLIRVTTKEFFPMFDVPFLYGRGWTKRDDEDPAQVVVISKYLNDKLFGGHNSVGRPLTVSGHPFTIVGVLDAWLPLPRFYDEARDFGPPDDVFIPFKWIESIPALSMNGFCLQSMTLISGFEAIAPSECLSTGVWVELDNRRQLREFSEFLLNYSRDQIAAGRFERSPNVILATVSKWLEMNDVVGRESKVQLVLAQLFLGICILNAFGLLLAKFMAGASLAGLRRALGATRGDIFRQHLLEALFLGGLAGFFGVAMAAGGLRLIRTFVFTRTAWSSDNPDYATIALSLSHMDGQMLLTALTLSLLAGFLAGLYPAWRIGRVTPASFLKIQ